MTSHTPPALARRLLPAALAVAALVLAPLVPAAAAQASSPAVSTSASSAALAAVVADPQLEVPGFDVSAFAHPTDQKPAVLWFWDRTQTEAQIDAKLESIHAAGFTETVIFRWFGDIPEAFFSEAWFDRVEHLLQKSRELGMTVWLDNDDKFPSGSAGGFIVNGGTVGDTTYEPRPDLRVKTLASGGSAVRSGGRPIALQDLFGSSVQLENGQVVADSTSAPGITLLRDGAEWTDYSVDATFGIVRATAGFMVRSPDELNGYLVDVRADGKVDIWNQRDGAFSPLRVGSTTRPDWSATAPHDISIGLAGSQIAITLDGVAEPPLSDSTHPAGGLGMRVDGNQAWRLDDLSVASVPSGDVLYANDFTSEDSVADFDAETSVLENVVAVAARPATGPGATDPAQIVDVTDDYLGDGVWDAPAGDWRIEAYRYTFRGGDRESYADTLDPEAQQLYTKIVFDEYYERFSDYFGTTLVGFADDEPEAGRHGDDLPPWTPALAERLSDSGLDTAAVVSSLFNDYGAAGETLRSQYYRAMSDQWVDAYWKTKYDWAEAHGISVLSNPLYDEYGPAGRVHESGNLLTMHQWAQVPGTDLIADQVENGMVRNLPYEPASVAHQLGRPLVYDELMGATGWQKSLADVRQGTAMSAVRGINKALFHATFDAPETAPFPPTFSDDNVWWRFLPEVTEWTGRLMEFGRHTTAAPTAVLQMQRAAEAVQLGDQSSVDGPFFAVEHSLEDAQVDFDLLDEGALSGDPAILAPAVVTADGTFSVGRMTYSAVVVPQAPLVSLEAVQTLLAFAEAGVEVVFAGAPPVVELHGRDAELASTIAAIVASGGDRVVTTDDPGSAGAAAAALGQAGVELAGGNPNVRVLRFQEGATAGYLLLNEGKAAVSTDVTFPAAGVPVLWNPDTGDVTAFSTYRTDEASTTAPMTLEPGVPVGVTVSASPSPDAAAPHAVSTTGPGIVQSVSALNGTVTASVRSSASGTTDVRATDGETGYFGSVVTPELPAGIPLDGDWTMQLDNGSSSVDRPLASWTDLAPSYSGTATYTREFDLTASQADADWTLDLGRVANAAEISVNGTAIGDRIAAPYRIDLGDALVEGSNTLSITVTNTDGNSRGITAESGLLGPVALSPFAVTTAELGALSDGGVRTTGATATMDASGVFATVAVEVENSTDQPVTGVAAISGAGWQPGPGAPVTVPPGGTATATAGVSASGFIPDGTVDLTAAFVVDGSRVDARSVTLDTSFGTPPADATDHVDLGDAASESAHHLTASATSGTNSEAGLSRRYGGYRVPDAWYQFDLDVKAGQPFLLQGLETYNGDPQVKGYRVFVDGSLVATRLNVRDLRQEGTAAYRLVVPGEAVASDRVTVRVQSLSNPDYSDPSLADVWAVAIAADTTAPVVTVSVSADLPGDGGWQRGPATVLLTATDDRPGDVAVEYDAGSGWAPYEAGFTVATEGVTTIAYRATDAAGNVSEAGALPVQIDSIAPTVTAELDHEYAPDVAIAPATLTLTGTDAASGVAETRYRVDGGAWVAGAQITLADAGDHTVTYATADVAGNVSADAEYRVTVLAEAPAGPVVSAAVSHPGSAGWYLGGAAVTLTATPGSGAASVATLEYVLGDGDWQSYTAPVPLAEGSTTVRYRATDEDGRFSPAGSLTARVDATAPHGWAWFTAAGDAYTTVQDELSGAGLGQYSLDGETWVDGLDAVVASGLPADARELWFRSTDVAGNVGEVVRAERQETPPSLEVLPGKTIVAEGFAFTPGSEARVELHSDPVLLGTATATARGVVTVRAVVPASVPPGSHRLVFVETAGGSVTIPADVLASTGSGALVPAGIALVVLLTGALLLAARRIRRPGRARVGVRTSGH